MTPSQHVPELVISAVLIALAWSDGARADCVTRFRPALGAGDWQGAMADYVAKRQAGASGRSDFTLAVKRLDAEIQGFDSLKPGPLYRVAETLTDLESAVTDIGSCEPLPPQQASAWTRTLETAATEFLVSFGDPWEAYLLRPGDRLAANDRGRIYASPMLRRLVQARRPALWAKIDTDESAAAARVVAEGAEERRQVLIAAKSRLKALEEARLAQAEGERREQESARVAQAAAERSTAIRKAATFALPAQAGPWSRSPGERAYVRVLNGVRTTLGCGVAGGLVLKMKRLNGKFVFDDTDRVAVRTVLNGRPRIVWANLRGTGSSKSTRREFQGEVETTTYYYDPTEAYLSIQSPEMMAAYKGKMFHAAGDFLDKLSAGAGGENPISDLMRGLGDLTASTGTIAAPLELDIDEVKTQPSLKLVVGAASWTIDLEPTRPPFKSLMDACWG